MNSLTSVEERSGLGVSVAYLGNQFADDLELVLSNDFDLETFKDVAELTDYLDRQTLLSIPDVIIIETMSDGNIFDLIKKVKANPVTGGLIIILLALGKDVALKQKAIELKVHDLYFHPFNINNLLERIKFLIKFKLVKPNISLMQRIDEPTYQVIVSKRLFDILVSCMALLLLSPIMLIIALLVKVGSKGPVIYKSKRAGTGYQVFDFYKFRSMTVDADKQLASLATFNQYAAENGGHAAFVKIKNDPRITKLGSFLRKTSLDELPQLFNVLKGDMSLVGNRPLPLYEAEMLTSNEWSMRFLGPAGITGLWQISKRGKSEMSDFERRKLDNFYASHYSFWIDLKIILKTIPALLQKEKV